MQKEIKRIAVFGSWRELKDQRHVSQFRKLEKVWSNKNTREKFQEACENLGYVLAESQRFQILVASDSPSTVDYHIVQGIIRAQEQIKSKVQIIWVIRSKAPRSSKGDSDCSQIYQNLIDRYPYLFRETTFFEGNFTEQDKSTEKWEQVHDFIVEQADKILVLGGGDSSYRIAVRALSKEKFVVPIGCFGGAGEELIKMLEHVRDQHHFPKYEYRQILANANWEESQFNATLYALDIKQDPNKRQKIFINYRRSDSSSIAGRIYEKLRHKFSNDVVFMDIHSIEFGAKYRNKITNTLKQTAVLLVIIGPKWLTLQDEKSGRRRLDNVDDLVRFEIETAIKDSIAIIPICIERAEIPKKEYLPDSIAELSDLNMVEISSDNFDNKFEELVENIKKYLKVK